MYIMQSSISVNNIFEFKGARVRVVFVDGQPWWVAKDVCEVLAIEKHRDAISRLDDDERGSVVVDTLGGPQEMATVNESGLYSLILTSRKPEAREFKRWITHEVIPSIRKDGAYVAKQLQGNPTPRITLLSSEFEGAKRLARSCGIADENQVLLSANRILQRRYGAAPLEMTERQMLPSNSQEVHRNPTEIGEELGGLSGKRVNALLFFAGMQIKRGDRWEPTELGKPHCVIVDVGKRHTDGAPVTQLRWRSSVIPLLRAALEAEKNKAS